MAPMPGATSITRRLAFLSTSGWMVQATSLTISGTLEGLQVEVHFAGLDFGEVEDVVDQGEQVAAGGVDLLQIGDEDGLDFGRADWLAISWLRP